MSEAGVHRPHVAGIHGREDDGSYSIVLSGGYEDDKVRNKSIVKWQVLLWNLAYCSLNKSLNQLKELKDCNHYIRTMVTSVETGQFLKKLSPFY